MTTLSGCPDLIYNPNPHYHFKLGIPIRVLSEHNHTVQNRKVILDKLPRTFDTWFGVYHKYSWIMIKNLILRRKNIMVSAELEDPTPLDFA